MSNVFELLTCQVKLSLQSVRMSNATSVFTTLVDELSVSAKFCKVEMLILAKTDLYYGLSGQINV